jgi:hypothetical protein
MNSENAMAEIILVWLVFSVIVGVAANERGRNGAGWFFISMLISPLIAGLFVLALGRSEKIQIDKVAKRSAPRMFHTRTSEPGLAAQRRGPFEPEGVYGGIPFRRLRTGGVDAMMSGGLVHFKDVEHFQAVVSGKSSNANSF